MILIFLESTGPPLEVQSAKTRILDKGAIFLEKMTPWGLEARILRQKMAPIERGQEAGLSKMSCQLCRVFTTNYLPEERGHGILRHKTRKMSKN